MMQHLPSFRALRALEAVVRNGNVMRAAEEIGVTPGAISKHLTQLADELGTALFEPGHRLKPTAGAQDLARAVGLAIGQLRRACEDAADVKSTAVLTVVAHTTLTMHWLVPRLVAAQEAVGGRPVRVHPVHSTDDWRQTPFDVAILRHDRIPPGWERRVLGRERLTLFAAPERAARLAAGGLQALAGETFLVSDTRHGELQAWLAAAGLAGNLEPKVFAHFYVALEAAVAGQGVIVGPTWLADAGFRQGRLARPFPAVATDGTRLVGVYDPAVCDGKTADRLLAWVGQELCESVAA
ncbi:LysR substrate-binding domain-containing protein [Phreatobacter stygius]|uniref:LysR family transcriptional regulator n=1 Tax=Phreatobacter stygius TaxID=1940610 RepID=A0A4D7BKR1_9HYPH|nr:LysR substrate-binding domain-containing protein [Phreatobacter stygius]QCI68332.1 LysR family transcriptional regulator [Phreatobacter stygius]